MNLISAWFVRANEKGHVENLVGFGRRNYLVPVPKVNTLEELNAELERRCREDLERTLRGKSQSKQALLQEELAAMLDLPRQTFDARRVTHGPWPIRCRSCVSTITAIRFP